VDVKNAPAMQVAIEVNMLDGDALDKIVAKHQPDFIVPEIAIKLNRTFYDYEQAL
jgi:phosphoribosylglycinamide formyltransferase 2